VGGESKIEDLDRRVKQMYYWEFGNTVELSNLFGSIRSYLEFVLSSRFSVSGSNKEIVTSELNKILQVIHAYWATNPRKEEIVGVCTFKLRPFS
jgi:hypothetical protein